MGSTGLFASGHGEAFHADFLFFMEGESARLAGEPQTTNPYEPASRQAQQWLAGWQAAAAAMSHPAGSN